MTAVKVKGGYKVKSKTGKNLSKTLSKEGANKRLREVEYFKRQPKAGKRGNR